MNTKLYVVISNTKTEFSKKAKKITGNDYNHISISFDRYLETMYTFDMKVNGLKIESPDNISPKAQVLVYSVEITNEQYQNIKKFLSSDKIRSLNYNKKQLLFSSAAALLERANIKVPSANNIASADKGFICASFVGYIINTFTDSSVSGNVYNPSAYQGQFKFEFRGSIRNINASKPIVHLYIEDRDSTKRKKIETLIAELKPDLFFLVDHPLSEKLKDFAASIGSHVLRIEPEIKGTDFFKKLSISEKIKLRETAWIEAMHAAICKTNVAVCVLEDTFVRTTPVTFKDTSRLKASTLVEELEKFTRVIVHYPPSK